MLARTYQKGNVSFLIQSNPESNVMLMVKWLATHGSNPGSDTHSTRPFVYFSRGAMQINTQSKTEGKLVLPSQELQTRFQQQSNLAQ